METIIRQGLAELGLTESVPENAPSLLAEYGRLLLEKNQVMNLTAIREPEQAARLHMLDCAALLRCGPLAGKTLIDVGTGAGFPGMALKILQPELKVTLLDSLNKRLLWLEEVKEVLELKGLRTVHARAEEFAAGHREGCDIVTSRAVAALPMLCELCLPLVKVGGVFVAMKSVDSDAELRSASRAISLLGGADPEVKDYVIPGTQVTHRAVLIKKIRKTPEKYPRMFAKIKKNPL